MFRTSPEHLVEGRAALPEDEYFEKFVAEFRRLVQRYKLPMPPKISRSPDANETGVDESGPTELVVEVSPATAKQNPVVNARHVFGHFLVDLGSTDKYGDVVANIVGHLIARSGS